MIGQAVARYRIQSKIGAGGMGEVSSLSESLPWRIHELLRRRGWEEICGCPPGRAESGGAADACRELAGAVEDAAMKLS